MGTADVASTTTTPPAGAIRVEELARRAEVSVDTIRFYQKRQLLPPPRRAGRIAWYGADHVERLQRIKELQRQGFSLAVIRRLLAGEFDAADVPRAGLRLLEAGFPLPDLLALARRHHDATRAIAADAVEMFDEHVRRPIQTSELDDDVKAERLVEAFRTLLPTVTTLVANHFRSVLLEVAQEHLEAVGDPRELAAARGEA